MKWVVRISKGSYYQLCAGHLIAELDTPATRPLQPFTETDWPLWSEVGLGRNPAEAYLHSDRMCKYGRGPYTAQDKWLYEVLENATQQSQRSSA